MNYLRDAVLNLGVSEHGAEEPHLSLLGSECLQGAQVRLGHRGVDAFEAEHRLLQDEQEFGHTLAFHGLRHCSHLSGGKVTIIRWYTSVGRWLFSGILWGILWLIFR